MKTFLLLSLLLATAPTIPPEAVLSDQRPVAQCDSGLLLQYYYDLPDGSVWVAFKQPNQDARIVMRWKPGNDEAADDVWVDGRALTVEELRARYPHPCVLFDMPK